MEDINTTTERLEANNAEQPLNLDIAKLEALRLLQIGGMSFAFLGTVSKLAAAEMVLSAKTIPKILGIGLFLIPIVYFTWLSFSALVAWAVYTSANNGLLAFAVFFLLQCLLLGLGLWYIKRAAKSVGIAQTKAQVRALIEVVKHEFQGEHSRAQ